MAPVNPLDALTERLSGAAANPPTLVQDKVILSSPRRILPTTTSSGARRPVLRVSAGQNSQVKDRAIREAEADARRTLTAQARKELAG